MRNAYATYLVQGDSPWKRGLIFHSPAISHGIVGKDLSAQVWHASD